MKLKINTYKDLNNVLLKLRIDKKIYFGTLYAIDGHMELIINMSKDIKHWKNFSTKRETICGSFLSDDIDVTLFDCIYVGKPYTLFTNDSGKKKYQVEFIIGRILLGKKVHKLSNKIISKARVKYDNIDSFTNDMPYNFDAKSMTYSVTPSNYQINGNGLKINICFSCKNLNGNNLLSVERETLVDFNFTKKINIKDTLDEFYKFRCFLIILLRKHITINNQIITINDEDYRILDCRIDKPHPIDEDFFSHRMVKIEAIKNIDEVYQEFQNQYSQLFPAMDVYYNTISCFIPNINRFILGTTALEYFSNEYNNSNALNLTKTKDPKAKEPNYVDKVECLISNVNNIINCPNNDVSIISENIKNARVYYIHYNKKRKKLTDDEQQYYSYFVFDILLLNIYKVIKLDLFLMETSCHNGLYYEINDLK